MNENTIRGAEIVSIGTEILLGNITDTNAAWLAQELAALGINNYWISQVGDNQGRLVEVLERAWNRSDLTILTGGLGPTEDDVTREAISAMLGEQMVAQPELEAELRAFSRRGGTMPEGNVKQATLIPSSQILHNPVGTAPGWWVERTVDGHKRIIITMPGVPHEMKRMWSREAMPHLVGLSGAALASRTLKLIGIGESAAEDRIRDLLHSNNPTIGTYAKNDGVHLRLTARAATRDEAFAMLEPLEAAVRERVGEQVWGIDEEPLEDAILRLLADRKLRMGLIEVGGASGGAIIRLLSSSELAAQTIVGSMVLTNINGNDGTIAALAEGQEAVSRERALELARTARGMWAGEIGLATVGVLPSGADDSRVQGEMMAAISIGAADGEETRSMALRLPIRSARGEVKRLMALGALNLLRKELLEQRGS